MCLHQAGTLGRGHVKRPPMMRTDPTRSPPLSWLVKAGYGLGDLGINIFVIVKSLLVFDFMTAYLQVDPAVAGRLTALVLIFDILTDPLIGWLSDRSRTPWGRRAPFMVLGAVAMAVLLVLMFMVPASFSGLPAALWVTGFFAAASVGWTMVVIPYSSLTVEMTQDPHERSSLTAFRMASAAAGILLAGALFPALVALFGGQRAGFALAMLTFAPLAVASIWIAAFASLKAPRRQPPPSAPFFQQLAVVASNPRFVLLVVVYGLQTLAIFFITVGIPHAARYLTSEPGAAPIAGAQTLLFAAFVVGAMASQPLWLMLSKRFGKPRIYLFGMLVYAGVLGLFFSQLPVTSAAVLALLALGLGITNGCYQQLPWAMVPDLIAETNAKSGQSVEGLANAAWLFGQKLAGALAPLLFGELLARFGFQASDGGLVEQPSTALMALRFGMTALPALLLLATVPLYAVIARRLPSPPATQR